MDRLQLRATVGIGMVGIGAVQTGYGALQSDWVLTVLGLLYAIVAVGFVWTDVYAADQ